MRHRSFAALALAAVASLGLAACGGSGSTSSDASGSGSSSDVVTLTVGATPSPHAKILTYINDNLAAAEGIKLDIVEYTDYIQPNTALNDGDLDANFYQTVPYLENAEKQFGFDFEAGEGIHLEPLGVFSNKHKSLDELPDGGTIGIINDTANQSRALELLATQGLVSIPEGGGDVNINTITKLKNFNFREVEGPQLVRSLDDFDYAVINGNFAQEGGKTISGDALVVESPVDNPAVNVLVWKDDSKKADAIAKLEKLLHSDEVKQYIEKTWSDGSVIPAF
ncbi:MetQ/NlpA family ABC transporter substrate-binding protein [uncultured Actinomyces sp.]|uniref:MetQ/NlpA family ABC transporter substrate-binding protein n=1 Tax=uncultured Actinomyces sp. TaxID=249061 RepID=UPI0026183DF9|nr:MetQ/NlpA family ABC transporter substrate-binding protein [uncultured Actinomyces sp.]